MDFDTIIAKRQNKAETIMLARALTADPSNMQQLWTIIKNGSPDMSFHIAWLFEICATENQDAVKPFVAEMVEVLPLPYHNGVHRSLTKTLTRYDIPSSHEGVLYNLCMEWLLDPKRQVAIKVHCMQIAFNIGKNTPELLEELELVVKDQLEFNSVAFAARAKHIIKQIRKIQQS